MVVIYVMFWDGNYLTVPFYTFGRCHQHLLKFFCFVCMRKASFVCLLFGVSCFMESSLYVYVPVLFFFHFFWLIYLQRSYGEIDTDSFEFTQIPNISLFILFSLSEHCAKYIMLYKLCLIVQVQRNDIY